MEAAEDVREDLESILDEAATVLPEKRLLWHYRSQTNDLIEFSNAKYYNGALQTFPDNSPEEDMGVDFEYVEDGLYDRGGSSTNEPEARRVLELVREHIEKHSDRSLGVVAFSSAQAQAIRDIIEQERDSDPDLDAFVSEDDALEGFFIKSLENVQGDERDSLIFSVGYGPDSSGKISMNFGPLNHTGGERRLNVAVTRAKKHIQVVSSLQPGQIDLQRTGARGVRDFKHYLEYAKNGGQALARSDSEPQMLHFDSEFEEAVYTALEERGFDVVTQVESSGYSIDLAIKHPEKPGKYVLGIECDGAAYHHSKTARDRDRTRQAVLEDLGWTIHRIWSPDWASNKESEIGEIEAKVEQLVEGRMTTDGGAAATEIETVEVDAIPEGQRGGIEDHLSDWMEPRVAKGRDKSFDEVPIGRAAGVLKELVNEHGPIEREQAFRTTISRWHITRLGKRIKKRLNRIERKMKRQDHVVVHDGFFWPAKRPDSIPLRRNTSNASRSIESIPLEELAYAGHLILEAGTRMSREDLILEIARLYEYQRIGSNIKDRTDDAVAVLLSEGCARTDDSGEYIEYIQTDGGTRLLNRIYGSEGVNASDPTGGKDGSSTGGTLEQSSRSSSDGGQSIGTDSGGTDPSSTPNAQRKSGDAKDQLRQLLNGHHKRVIDSDGNLFVEIVFEWGDGTAEPYIQYQDGLINLTALDTYNGLVTEADDLFFKYDIETESKGEKFMTGRVEGATTEEVISIIESALSEIYTKHWMDVHEVREREL